MCKGLGSAGEREEGEKEEEEEKGQEEENGKKIGRKKKRQLECSLVVKHSPKTCKALCSMPTPAMKKENRRKRNKEYQ